MKHEVFNASYYSTAAQVIPVLFVGATLTRFWSSKRNRMPAERHLFLILTVLVAFAGEYVALDALATREPPGYYEDVAIGLAMFISGVMICVNLLADPIGDLTSRIPEHRRATAWRLAEVIWCGLILAVAILHADLKVIAIAVAGALVLVVCFLGMGREIVESLRSMRRSSGTD